MLDFWPTMRLHAQFNKANNKANWFNKPNWTQRTRLDPPAVRVYSGYAVTARHR